MYYLDHNVDLRLSLSASLNPNFEVLFRLSDLLTEITLLFDKSVHRPNFSSAKGSAKG